MDGADIRRVLDLEASAAQLGSAFLLAAEAGTSPVHRAAVAGSNPTVLTRAFTGRTARGIENAWSDAGVDDDLPSAYPEVHHLTSALRAHGRAVGDPDLVNLWAGANHRRAQARPAADIVAALVAELTEP
jgi:nitronate monooxygenase